MIQFTLKTTDGVKRITAPHSWSEINFEQLIAIENENNHKGGLIKLFSIICGLDFQMLAESTDRKLFEHVRDVCAFIEDYPDWEHVPFPKTLELNGKVYPVPQKVSNIMHGQIELLQSIGAKDNLMEDMPKAVAIIMQPSIDGKYDGERVQEIEEWVKKAAGMECWGIATFFFRKLYDFLSIGIKRLMESPTRKTTNKQHYKDWLKPIGLEDLERLAASTQ